MEVDGELGFGLAGGIDICDGIGLSGGLVMAPITLHYDIDGIKFGGKFSTKGEATLLGWDMISIGYTEFEDYITKEVDRGYGEDHIIGLSVGGYLGVGGSVGFGWNIDYIVNRFTEIWW